MESFRRPSPDPMPPKMAGLHPRFGHGRRLTSLVKRYAEQDVLRMLREQSVLDSEHERGPSSFRSPD